MKVLASITIFFLILVSTPSIFAQDEFAPIEFVDPLFRPTQEGLSAFFSEVGVSVTKIIGALIVLLIGLGVSFAVKKGVKYLLKGVFSINQLQEQTKIDPNNIGKKKAEGWTRLVNQIPEIFFWFIFAFFFIFALNTLGLDQASDAMTQFWVFVPRLIAALVFLVAGFIAERIVINSVQASTSPYYGRDSGIKVPIQVIIYSIVISIAVTQLGIGEEIIPILVWVIGIGIMGGFAISVGLGGRFFIMDVISLWSLRQLGIKEGAEVEYTLLSGSSASSTIKGKVVKMSSTHLKMIENEKTFVIPTQSIFGQRVTIVKEAEESKKEKKNDSAN